MIEITFDDISVISWSINGDFDFPYPLDLEHIDNVRMIKVSDDDLEEIKKYINFRHIPRTEELRKRTISVPSLNEGIEYVDTYEPYVKDTQVWFGDFAKQVVYAIWANNKERM